MRNAFHTLTGFTVALLLAMPVSAATVTMSAVGNGTTYDSNTAEFTSVGTVTMSTTFDPDDIAHSATNVPLAGVTQVIWTPITAVAFDIEDSQGTTYSNAGLTEITFLDADGFFDRFEFTFGGAGSFVWDDNAFVTLSSPGTDFAPENQLFLNALDSGDLSPITSDFQLAIDGNPDHTLIIDSIVVTVTHDLPAGGGGGGAESQVPGPLPAALLVLALVGALRRALGGSGHSAS